MFRRYQTDYPNQVHQLLVTVSKHHHIGAKGQLRHQAKEMDVKLDKLAASGPEHLVHYFLRDHYSGLYYAEVCSSKSLILINDFLLRAWWQNAEFYFCGIPEAVMITKVVENYFPEAGKLAEKLQLQTMNPPSGFASGMEVVAEWEKNIHYYSVMSPLMESFSVWNPRVYSVACAFGAKDKIEIWRKCTVRVPDADYCR